MLEWCRVSSDNPINLANEIYILVCNSGSNGPFHMIFSGNVPLIKGFELKKERNSYHLPNCQYLRLNVKRVWSKMNIYSNFDYWILEWLVVALCLPSMRLNGLKTYEI